jgi:glutamine synthetase
MKESAVAMNPNPIVRYLGKPPEEFTREDLVQFMEHNKIEAVNFRPIGGDGRLKTLNFVITSRAQVDRLLSVGERVDGSSLFPYVAAASSDLYVVPRYRTAYVNPFSSVPTVDILCSYYTSEGERLPSSPGNILRSAGETLEERTGLRLEAMGELEYYILHEPNHLYPTAAQKGYMESSPFCNWEGLRCEAMLAIAQTGGSLKYGHSEVGHIRAGDQEMEQDEIEFAPVALEDAADQIAVARWALRMVGCRHGVTVTFAPKILVGHAGSGLHIHSRLVKGGRSVMVEQGRLSETARKLIAGHLSLAPSLTAFGNTIPLSFLRLTPKQEAPTNVCWGDGNRSVLVRVPLGWLDSGDMLGDANPDVKEEAPSGSVDAQTVEFRSPDGSANVHLLLAGLAVGARHGLEMEGALDLAERLYVDSDIFRPENKNIRKRLPQLPASCWESADCLLKDREVYEAYGVFPPAAIDGVAKMLKDYDDRNLSRRVQGKEEEVKKLVDMYLHCA